MGYIIAIDGPAGAGKSTVARRVAIATGFTYLDTGAMYRTIALHVRREGIAVDEETRIVELANRVRISFSPLGSDETQRVYSDEEEITSLIRTPDMSEITSQIASLGGLRKVVVELQRDMAATGERGVVLEGRDIGTVVFPNADLKIFLTASVEERSRRRLQELLTKGAKADSEAIRREIIERDARDSGRKESPLKRAEDAHEVVTDGLTIDEAVERILELCRK